MKKWPAVFLVLLCLLTSSFSAEIDARKEGPLALTGGILIDGTGSAPVRNSVVVIEGERIKAVGQKNEVTIPRNAKIIDITGKWILPGFIDLHIHLHYPLNTEMDLTDTDSLRTLRALHVMNKYMKSGVTCIRDVTSRDEPLQALKRAKGLGYTDTIRFYSVGKGIAAISGRGDDPEGVNGPYEWRRQVRIRKSLGYDSIKVFPPYTAEEVKAAVDEAKVQGMRITSHSGSFGTDIQAQDCKPPFMSRIAVENDIHCLEHIWFIDDETLKMMAEKKTHLVPTIAMVRNMMNLREQTPKQSRNYPKCEEYFSIEVFEQVFKKAREMNILMGIGTDYVWKFTEQYPQCYFEEMKYFVELGFTPIETIVCATKNAGIILGKEDELGTIEAGKLADIQVISGNPLESFDVLGHPDIVIIGGGVHEFK